MATAGEGAARTRKGAMIADLCSRGRALAIRLLGASLVVLAGAAYSFAQPVKLRLVFPTAIETFTLPYLVAKQQGWYAQGGVEVEEVFVRGGSTAVRLIVAGSDDVAIVGLAAVFNAIIEGARLKTIGSWQPIPDYKLVAGKSVGTSLDALAGKVIAVTEPGDATAFLPSMVLRKHGVPTGDLRFLGVGGHATRLMAVTSGRAQATILNSRTTVVGQNAGSINVLTTLSDEFPLFGYVVLVTNENRLTDPIKRKALETFLEASTRGARFILSHPDEATDILRARMTDVDRNELRKTIGDLNATKVWGHNTGSDPDIIKFSAQISREFGNLRKELSVDEVMDGSLADAVLKRLGKM